MFKVTVDKKTNEFYSFEYALIDLFERGFDNIEWTLEKVAEKDE